MSSLNIVKATYNPGMNPFLPQPVCRFDCDSRIGDEGVTYEFNVKILKIQSSADFVDWDIERQVAYGDFELLLQKKFPFFTLQGFTGRSGGWLALEDPQGRMTEARLKKIQKLVAVALLSFKKHMIATFPLEETP